MLLCVMEVMLVASEVVVENPARFMHLQGRVPAG